MFLFLYYQLLSQRLTFHGNMSSLYDIHQAFSISTEFLTEIFWAGLFTIPSVILALIQNSKQMTGMTNLNADDKFHGHNFFLQDKKCQEYKLKPQQKSLPLAW